MKKLIIVTLLVVAYGLVHGQNAIQKIVKVDGERYLEYNGIRYTLSPKYILVKPNQLNQSSKFRVSVISATHLFFFHGMICIVCCSGEASCIPFKITM